MAKKDSTTRLDIGREETSSDQEQEAKISSVSKSQQNRTEVKNAHATGLGAIGRNDQKEEKDEQGFNNY